MEEIAAGLTDAIAHAKTEEVKEDPEALVKYIEEDLEAYTERFENFKNKYKERVCSSRP